MWQGYAFADGFSRGARPRLHARGPEVHAAPGGREAARDVPELPRLALRRVQEGRRRRHRQGLREDQRDALCGGGEAGEASGRLHRLPRQRDVRAASHPPRVHRGHARLQGLAGRPELRREQAGHARRRCAPTCAASATSSTTSRAPRNGSCIRGRKASRSSRSSPTTTRSAFATGPTRTPAPRR